MAMNVQELRMRLHHARQQLDAEVYRITSGGPLKVIDAELLVSMRSMVDSLTEELRTVDPGTPAKRQRTTNNPAESSTAGPPGTPRFMRPAPRAAAAHSSMRPASYSSAQPPPPPPKVVDRHLKTFELLALLVPGVSEVQRLQAMQVLAVRSGSMQREQQIDIVNAPNALAHITVLMYHDQAAMRQAAATCLGNLTEHQTQLGATQGVLLGLVMLLKDSCKHVRFEAVRSLLKLTEKHAANLALLKAVPGIEPAVEAIYNERDANGKKVDTKKKVQLANKLLKRLQGREHEGKQLRRVRGRRLVLLAGWP